MLEVCIDSLTSGINAIRGGADEIELCSYLRGGGFTPSIGLVDSVQRVVGTLPEAKRPTLNAMIRVEGDSFKYSDLDMKVMLSDLTKFKELGIYGFVFGALTANSEVDEARCIQFLKAAAPNRVTFSRAFDYTKDFKKAAAKIAALGFHRILTSGLRANVSVDGAVDNIAYLTKNYTQGPGPQQMVVMPGCGISIENVVTFINIGCPIIHCSCKKRVLMSRMEDKDQTELNDNNSFYVTDTNLVRDLKEAITNAMTLKQEKERTALSSQPLTTG